MIPNYKLAAHIAEQRGLQWLASASDAELSAATDEALRARGKAQDSRLAVTCLRAIREYSIISRLVK
jgi:hypothetical protein